MHHLFGLSAPPYFNHIARYAHKIGCTAYQKIRYIYHRIKVKTVSKNTLLKRLFISLQKLELTILLR